MKLENFQYKITARAEGAHYHVCVEGKPGDFHEFMAHHAGSMWVVVSPEISDMYEASMYAEAEELRGRLLSIFCTHYTAIESATGRTTATVDVFSP